MPNYLNLPDDLNALIEKRNGEDRRQEADDAKACENADHDQRQQDRRQSTTRKEDLPGEEPTAGQ